MPRGRGTAKFKSRGPGSAISSEGKSCPVEHIWHSKLTSSSHIVAAARNPIGLDDKQVAAVAARIELDLRIGFAFTRFLTLNLRPLGGPMSELTLSYGGEGEGLPFLGGLLLDFGDFGYFPGQTSLVEDDDGHSVEETVAGPVEVHF